MKKTTWMMSTLAALALTGTAFATPSKSEPPKKDESAQTQKSKAKKVEHKAPTKTEKTKKKAP